jgi:sugar phosphate isomerase/epimerase
MPQIDEQFGLSQFTTGKLSFRDDLKLCEELGIGVIEVCESKLPESEREAEDELKALRDSGRRVASVQARVHSLFPDSMAAEPARAEARVDAMRRTMERFALALPEEHPNYVLIGGQAPDHDFCDARDTLITQAGRLAHEAQAHGGRIAFEPLHPVMMNTDTFVCRWEEAVHLATIVAHDAFGLVCDIWNVWDQREIIARVQQEIGRVALFHASDWHKGGPRKLNDRMVPGRGVIPFAEWGRMLREVNYAGPLCLEMLSDESLGDSYLHEEPAKVIAEAREFLRGVGCIAAVDEGVAAK